MTLLKKLLSNVKEGILKKIFSCFIDEPRMITSQKSHFKLGLL